VAHNVDQYLKAWADPVPMLQVFGERYIYGSLAPRRKSVIAGTVEDGLRVVGQARAILGSLDPHKDSHCGIYFRIQHKIKAYTKADSPPRWVKPIPIIIIVFIMAHLETPILTPKWPSPT
jgi:hypothetical protein